MTLTSTLSTPQQSTTITGLQKKQAYSNDHSANTIALHSRRTVSDSAAYLLEPLLKAYGPRSDAQLKFLDVGCGPGTITIDFALNYYPKSHFTGIDYTDAPVDLARGNAQRTGASNNTEFHVGDIHSLDFLDESFDVVYCHQVLQHISNPVQALSEMRRVCKKGGIVAAKESCHAQWYPESPAFDAKFALNSTLSRAMGGNPFPGHYIHVWAKQAGFKPDQVTCSASSWVFSTREEREYWGGSWAKRLHPDGGSAQAKNALDGGYATREGLLDIVNAFKKWVDDDDGWYSVWHGEIVCKKED